MATDAIEVAEALMGEHGGDVTFRCFAASRGITSPAQAYAVQTSDPSASHYARGDRVFHQKFGYGRVSFVEGNKLTVDFDKAGEKKVIDQFVTRA